MSKEVKQRAREMLESGSEISEVIAETQLSTNTVRGIKGSIVKQRKKKPAQPGPDEELASLGAQMKAILDEYGYRKASSALSLMESYGFSIGGIHASLKDCGAPLSVIRYTIRRWAAYQNLEIPRHIEREIGPGHRPGPTYPAGSYGDGYGDPNTTRELNDLRVQNAKLEERLKTSEEKRVAAEQNERMAQNAYTQEHERALKAEHAADLEALRVEFKDEINRKIGSGGSDLSTAMNLGGNLLREGTRLGRSVETFIKSGSIAPVPDPEGQGKAPPEARATVISELRKKNLVTRVVER